MDKKSRKHLQDVLAKNPPCYVLITCGDPCADGKLQVEMTYEGDTAVASYLLQGAQYYIDQEGEKESKDKIEQISLAEIS